MEIRMTRNMVVADGGVSRQFVNGQTYSVPADTAHRLFRTGAAHKLSLEEGKVTSDASKGSPSNNPGIDLSGLDDMTKDQLVAFAGEHSVEITASAPKAEIKAAIIAALG